MPLTVVAIIAATAASQAHRIKTPAKKRVVIAMPCEYCGRNSQNSGESSCCGCGAPIVLKEQNDDREDALRLAIEATRRSGKCTTCGEQKDWLSPCGDCSKCEMRKLSAK